MLFVQEKFNGGTPSMHSLTTNLFLNMEYTQMDITFINFNATALGSHSK